MKSNLSLVTQGPHDMVQTSFPVLSSYVHLLVWGSFSPKEFCAISGREQDPRPSELRERWVKQSETGLLPEGLVRDFTTMLMHTGKLQRETQHFPTFLKTIKPLVLHVEHLGRLMFLSALLQCCRQTELLVISWTWLMFSSRSETWSIAPFAWKVLSWQIELLVPAPHPTLFCRGILQFPP